MASDPLDLEGLLRQHGTGLRDLAAALLRDPSDAEDALQDVLVATLQRPPRHAGALAGWLAIALRNAAAKLRRSAGRRRRREQLVARRETIEDHVVVAAREEMVRRLVSAVLGLEAPYRQVIWARWFEGKAPREIARSSGEPIATIKSRLQRGVQMLRARLAADAGTDWRAALGAAFAFGKTPVGATGAALLGGFAMATWMKWAAVATVAAVGAWWSFDALTGTAMPARGAATADTSSTHPSTTVLATEAVDAAPAELGVTENDPTARRDAVASGDPALATITGRCVDERGEPLAGGSVQLHGWSGDQATADRWQQEHGPLPEWHDPEPKTTAADGRFELTFAPPPPFVFAIDIEAADHAAMECWWRSIKAGAHIALGDIAMSPGVPLAGRVVDADGAPQAEVAVSLEATDVAPAAAGVIAPVRSFAIQSRADGSFASHRRLTPRNYQVSTGDRVRVSPEVVAIDAVTASSGLAIVVARAEVRPTIEGRVVDENGLGMAEVLIADRSDSGRGSRSRRDGTFRLTRSPQSRRSSARLAIFANDCEPVASEPLEVAWGQRDVELRVRRGTTLTLRITDPAGTPIEDYGVRFVPRDRDFVNPEEARLRSPGAHTDGRTAIDGVTRGDWLLVVDFPATLGFASIVEPLRVQALTPFRLDLQAGTSAARTVRVLAGDAPVVGTTVQLCEPFGTAFPEARVLVRLDPWLSNQKSANALVLAEATTDGDGRVELRGPAGRPLGIAVLGPGHLPVRIPDVRLDTAGELAVRVQRGARLVGRIVPPEAVAELHRLARTAGSTFAGGQRPSLLLVDAAGRRFPPTMGDDRDYTSLSVRDDGTFDAHGLPTGHWQVYVRCFVDDSGPGDPGRAFHTTDVPAGDITLADTTTTQRDLGLAAILPGTVEGLVLLDGAPLSGGSVALQSETNWINIDTDAQGRFMQQCFAGDYRLLVQRERSGTWSLLHCATTVHVTSGAVVRETFAIDTGTLRIVVRNEKGEPAPQIQIHLLHADGHSSQLPLTDAAGTAVGEEAAETVTLRILPKSLSTPEAHQRLMQQAEADGERDPLARHWIVLTTVAIAAQQTTEVQVQLPTAAGY